MNSFGNGFKPQIRLGRSVTGTTVASSVNAKSEYLNSGNDLYIYNSVGEIMARVRNLSSHSYGCIDVTIDRTGTGATAFWNNSTANRIMDKTFRIRLLIMTLQDLTKLHCTTPGRGDGGRRLPGKASTIFNYKKSRPAIECNARRAGCSRFY